MRNQETFRALKRKHLVISLYFAHVNRIHRLLFRNGKR